MASTTAVLQQRHTRAHSSSEHTYHKISYDHSEQEERHTNEIIAVHAVPHRLYPLATQHTKNNHERVQEVNKVPAWSAVREAWRRHTVCNLLVRLAEQLHPHYGKNEDDDGKDKA